MKDKNLGAGSVGSVGSTGSEIAKECVGAAVGNVGSSRASATSQNESSKPTYGDSTHSKIANFPIALFASVMGIGGLGLSFKKAYAVSEEPLISWLPLWLLNGLGLTFALIASVIFMALLAFYGSKIVLHFHAFKGDLTHQVKINFLSALPISMLILVAFWSKAGGECVISLGVFYFASILQLVLSLYVITFWFKQSMKLHLLSPAWFIPIVGNLIVPLAGSIVGGNVEFMLFFFSIGCFFWLILTSLILQRLIFEQSLEEKFLPTLFIFIAPPSIFVVDFHAIFGTHGTLSLMAYFLALFFVLLLFTLSKIFLHIKFAPSWWAFTFPLCAFSIASFEIYSVLGRGFYLALGIFGLVSATLAVLFIAYKTILAIKSGGIFRE